jgi:hypothetical protein
MRLAFFMRLASAKKATTNLSRPLGYLEFAGALPQSAGEAFS